ncbi:hypothetical protein GOODEAATRI_015932, partial [Goodea atripinnis]
RSETLIHCPALCSQSHTDVNLSNQMFQQQRRDEYDKATAPPIFSCKPVNVRCVNGPWCWISAAAGHGCVGLKDVAVGMKAAAVFQRNRNLCESLSCRSEKMSRTSAARSTECLLLRRGVWYQLSSRLRVTLEAELLRLLACGSCSCREAACFLLRLQRCMQLQLQTSSCSQRSPCHAAFPPADFLHGASVGGFPEDGPAVFPEPGSLYDSIVKQRTSVGPSKTLVQPRRNIVGCRIQHIWKEGINPSLYLIKYDGFDCVYGLELYSDERVVGLEVLPDRARVSDSLLAETMIGKAVEHMFETEDGPKEEWRGMVLARAPIMTTWFYITYEKDPVLYMYQLLDDYKEGDLRIMPDSSEYDNVTAEREPGEVVDSLVGKQVEYAKEDGGKRSGMVIHQVEAKPSVYFIKFDDDFHIYVYDLVKTS